MTDLETATATLNELGEKLADAKQRQADAETQAAVHALDAHTGDATARHEMDRLNTEAARAAVEIRGLEAACASARRKVDEARAGEADAHQIAQAKQALALLSDFEARGEALGRICR